MTGSVREAIAKRAFRFAYAGLLCTCLGVGTPSTVSARPPLWSANLDQYGLPAIRPENRTIRYHYVDNVAIAATGRDVAVALVSQVRTGSPTKDRANPEWNVNLLIMDAQSGKLRVKCGPWRTGLLDGVWATPGGNFLVFLESARASRDGSSGELFVLSDSCQTLHDLIWPPLTGPHSWRKYWVSPSTRTVVTEEVQSNARTFETRDSETLGVRSNWSENGPDNINVISASDIGFLGKEPEPKDSPSKTELLYRAFLGDTWQKLPEAFANLTSGPRAFFLSNDAIIETGQETARKSQICGPSKLRIAVLRTDGTVIYSSSVAKHGYAISWPAAITPSTAVSADGRYFGSEIGFSGENWLWCALDMGPGYNEFFVWSSSDANPIKRVRLHASPAHAVIPLAFAPDGSWYALLNGNILSASRITAPNRKNSR